MAQGSRVTVEDIETGEKETKVIKDDWIVVCDGRYYPSNFTTYANGTAVITVKREAADPEEDR